MMPGRLNVNGICPECVDDYHAFCSNDNCKCGCGYSNA